MAPHTSNLDFFLGKLYYMQIGEPSGFMMKREWFFFPLGKLLRAMGGIPIDRAQRGDTVAQVSQYIQAESNIHIAITPEGTRSYTDTWRSGFYRIALAAGVPIELACIDYGRREIGIFEVFHPTGDLERDLAYIRSRYSSVQAKHPHKYHDARP